MMEIFEKNDAPTQKQSKNVLGLHKQLLTSYLILQIICNMTLRNRFQYVYSCDLDTPIRVKIGALEGQLAYVLSSDNNINTYNPHCATAISTNVHPTSDGRALFAQIQIYSDGRQIGQTIVTSYQSVPSFSGETTHFVASKYKWNEWITLPIRCNELSRDAVLVINICDYHYDDNDGPPTTHTVAGTALPLFSKRSLLRNGIYDLYMHPSKPGNGLNPDETSAKNPKVDNKVVTTKEDFAKQTRDFEKLAKKHRQGLIEKVDWLDRLAFREIEIINERAKRATKALYLMVEFPQIIYNNDEYRVVYFEKNAEQILRMRTQHALLDDVDYELGLENLVEAKHTILTRSARSNQHERNLKPNARQKEVLDDIIQTPSAVAPLSADNRDLIWKFRYSLSSNKKALVRFLQSVNWDQASESRQAMDLLQEWSPVDVDDALQLLSSEFRHASVRRYAVRILAKAAPDELQLYLLQLVEALKFDMQSAIQTPVLHAGTRVPLGATSSAIETDTPGTPSLESSVVQNDEEINSQQWTAMIVDEAKIADESINPTEDEDSNILAKPASEDPFVTEPDLATFLVSAACDNPTLANYLYWYLQVECESYRSASSDVTLTDIDPEAMPATSKNTNENQWAHMYDTMKSKLGRALMTHSTASKKQRQQLLAQSALVKRLLQMMQLIAKMGGNNSAKTDFLKGQLMPKRIETAKTQNQTKPNKSSEKKKSNIQQEKQQTSTVTETLPVDPAQVDFSALAGIALPLDPSILAKSAVIERTTLFSSKLMPARLTFNTIANTTYTFIFKHGDDLRQDQLVMQMIELMDRLLRADNLDLKLTPYKIIATGVNHGFVQFIESSSIAAIQKKFGSIIEYLKYYRPSPTGALGIDPPVLENYVRSLAGYSVISYILGLGDRHLDNLMLQQSGKMFHVDFGYILGRDPKPMPPPMKLTESMIEAMGGVGSSNYDEYRRLCYTTFLHLRRHANLILSLFALMTKSSIADIALEPNAVGKVAERLQLRLSDEEAVAYMQSLIDASLSAKMAVISDFVHDLAQALRS